LKALAVRTFDIFDRDLQRIGTSGQSFFDFPDLHAAEFVGNVSGVILSLHISSVKLILL